MASGTIASLRDRGLGSSCQMGRPGAATCSSTHRGRREEFQRVTGRANASASMRNPIRVSPHGDGRSMSALLMVR